MVDVGDYGIILGALGLISGIASAAYSRGQVVAARAQLKDAREQAIEALRAAELVAENARKQATEALHAAELVAENARKQAIEALRAAELVAENAREQAIEALRAAELVAENARKQAVDLAISDISARVRAMRASNFQSNPSLPQELQDLMKRSGGPGAYSVLLDAMEAAQDIYFLRKRGHVTDEQWRWWMHEDLPLVVGSPAFEEVFRRAAKQEVLVEEFVAAFEHVLHGRDIADPEGKPNRSG